MTSKKAKENKQTPMVKPFTIGNMQDINNRLLGNTQQVVDSNTNMMKYILHLTKHYAKTQQDIEFIKRLDEILNNQNRAIFHYIYELGEVTDSVRHNAVNCMIGYALRGMYLNLTHVAYSTMAYEFNIDGKLVTEKYKDMFIHEMGDLYRKIFGNIPDTLITFVDDAAKLTKKEVGEEEYIVLESSIKIDYLMEYSKAKRVYIVDNVTTQLAVNLSKVIFDILLYDEDITQNEYESVVDALVPIVDGFRKDFDILISQFSKILAVWYAEPTKDYYYYA